MAAKDPYLTLEVPLPSSEIPSILGHLVLHPGWPSSLRCPKSDTANVMAKDDPFYKLTQSYNLSITRKDAHFILNDSCDASLHASLTNLFNVAAWKANERELDISTAKVGFYMLTDWDVILDYLVEHYALQIGLFMNDYGRGKSLYMIVGFKTVVDENIKKYHRSGSKLAGQVTVPVMEAAQAAAGISPVIHFGNPSIGGSMSEAQKLLFEASGDGETIFAVLYQRVRRTTLLSRFWCRTLGHPGSHAMGIRLDDSAPSRPPFACGSAIEGSTTGASEWSTNATGDWRFRKDDFEGVGKATKKHFPTMEERIKMIRIRSQTTSAVGSHKSFWDEDNKEFDSSDSETKDDASTPNWKPLSTKDLPAEFSKKKDGDGNEYLFRPTLASVGAAGGSGNGDGSL